jgi:hypothetical protein
MSGETIHGLWLPEEKHGQTVSPHPKCNALHPTTWMPGFVAVPSDGDLERAIRAWVEAGRPGTRQAVYRTEVVPAYRDREATEQPYVSPEQHAEDGVHLRALRRRYERLRGAPGQQY